LLEQNEALADQFIFDRNTSGNLFKCTATSTK